MLQVLIWVILIILAIVLAIALIVVLLNFWFIELAKEKYSDIKRWQAVSWITSWAVPLLTFTSIEIEGVEKLGEENVETGVIYANHYSILDITSILKVVKRRHAYVAKKEIGNLFLLHRGMRLIKCGFLDRSDARAAIKTINEAVKTVKEGVLMVVFPEGTRVVESSLGTFKAGSFKIATKAKADIIPMTIYNTHIAAKRWPLPTKIKLKIHDPIPYEAYKDMETPDIAMMVEKIVKQDL